MQNMHINTHILLWKPKDQDKQQDFFQYIFFYTILQYNIYPKETMNFQSIYPI